MKTAWLECATGISGDMTLGALIDLGVDRQAIETAIASLKLPDVVLRIESVIKGGFRATHVLVDHPEQHAHRHYTDICKILDGSNLTDRQRSLARQLFLTVAESEARVHGSTIEKVHFHEVGAVDSIVDIVGAAVGFDLLNADRIVCNNVPTGRGFVNIDHGICPIPAPGTAEILKGVPLADIPIEAELTTPTGAAIVKTMADSFGPLPAMTIDSVGYGSGTMTFAERANVLRIFVGTEITNSSLEYVTLLETNLDDVSGEVTGHTRQRLMESGALDVFAIPVQMKKDRPGTILSVICRPADTERFEAIIFSETQTLGIRRNQIQRSIQHREMAEVNTPWGSVKGKLSWQTGGTKVFAPEFEDCASVAKANELPLRDVYRAAEMAFHQQANSATISTPSSNPPADSHSHDHDHHSHDHDHDHHSHDH